MGVWFGIGATPDTWDERTLHIARFLIVLDYFSVRVLLLVFCDGTALQWVSLLKSLLSFSIGLQLGYEDGIEIF